MTATIKVPCDEKLSAKAVTNVHRLPTFVLTAGTIRPKDEMIDVRIVGLNMVSKLLNQYLNC